MKSILQQHKIVCTPILIDEMQSFLQTIQQKSQMKDGTKI